MNSTYKPDYLTVRAYVVRPTIQQSEVSNFMYYNWKSEKWVLVEKYTGFLFYHSESQLTHNELTLKLAQLIVLLCV